MTKSLFNNFSEVSSKQWKQKIQADLKGADYNQTLIWNTNEGIDVKPFYHADEKKSSFPSPVTNASDWNICQSIFVADVILSNQKALDMIERGADSLKFILPSPNISIDQLLANIDTKVIQIYFDFQFLDTDFVNNIKSSFTSKNIHINTDIIGNLTRSGNWFQNLKDDFYQFNNIVKTTNEISIDLSLYQNAGATIVQQLAYAMCHGNEYLNHLNNNSSLEKGHSMHTTFNVSVGTNYFFEIAKLRALRLLWQTLATEYGINAKCYIFVTPTKRNKTLYDYNTNMLRTTTEIMSAILGGANTISNLAYDAIYHKDNEFGERISRNQLLVLKHESYFDKVNNPSDGAYYIESLTEQLSEKALELFKNIEANGGFLKQLKDGVIQRKIKASASKEQEQFDTGDEILIGTNKYPNPNDRMKHELELYPFIKTNPIKTLIAPIIEKRLAETMEQERLKSE